MLRIVAVLCAFALTGCAMNSVQQANSEQLEQGRMPALFKTAMVMGLSYRFATDDVTSVRYSLPRQFLWGQATYVRVIGQGKFGDRKPLDACAALQFLGGRLHRAVLVNNYFGHCDNLTEDLNS